MSLDGGVRRLPRIIKINMGKDTVGYRTSHPQLPLNIKIRKDDTFANFVEDGNQHVVSGLKNQLTISGEPYIYLWGTSGVGLSHLLQAACQRASEKGATSIYLPMKEVVNFNPDLLKGIETPADVIVANIWMAFLLVGAGMSEKVDKVFKADASAIEEVKEKMYTFSLGVAKIPNLTAIMVLCAIGFGGTALAHLGADFITPIMETKKEWLTEYRLTSLASGFFWIVVIATLTGLGLSFTRFKKYEGAGASKFGSAFLYILVATIGMKMDITAIFNNLGLFLVGIIWMIVHVIILLGVAKLIKAPFFFVAVGSQANVGGAASAPIVASAFSPSLAPVGVLLAVFGYAVGTFGAIICAQLMQILST